MTDVSTGRFENDPFDLPLDFQAFYLNSQEFFHSYAAELLGSRRDAEEAVHEAFCLIHTEWNDLLGSRSFEEETWSILRMITMRWLRAKGTRPAFLAKGAFTQTMDATRDQLTVLEESIGLYSAIAQLPDRQFDVIVLRYVLGYPTRKIAWLLGLDERTADYHARKGKEHLRRQLHLPESPRIKEANV
ncbi:sigma-70 family RNA polymerase sigma factor [Streptomyces sp. NPDC037389]|uniref:RNA polymerase sigma factor n=1 Tax=Streptomyces sp. NPDC037389 TaxID=3155369 RepID=UPI0033FE82A2